MSVNFFILFSANISATEIRRQKLSYQELCTFTAESASAWDEILSNKSNERVDKQVLLDIIRGGVPRARRGEIWQYLIKQYTVSLPDSSEKQLWKETPYRTILKKNTVHQHAILIDLGELFKIRFIILGRYMQSFIKKKIFKHLST